ncbi:purple acid phosphatase family protein [Runella sp.]|uniref:purple acid phosphatase family protein n=1 Tax=Runella sp. TaxID=1960881 RepID=UPI003D12DA9E
MKTFPLSDFKKICLFLFAAFFTNTLFAQTTFIGFKSSGWKYREAYQEPGTFGTGTWKTNAYSDAAWASGQATLGYDDITTTHTITTWVWPLNANRTGTNSSKTHYFRKTFNVASPGSFTGYRIKTWCDDGLVVYLNNKEVYRLNMPVGTIDSLTSASTAPANDSIYGETTINLPSDLLTGTNVIAVEVHQSGSSIDRYFDLSIEGLAAPASCPEWPIAFKSTNWKQRVSYLEPTTFGNGTWKTNAYSDAAWSSGQATLGYDDGTPTHAINTWLWTQGSGRTGTNTSKTHYFRKCFNITDKNAYSGYRIKTWCDDGLVAYLNGREIFRLNMPVGTVDSLTFAISAPPNDSIYKDTTVYLPADLLNGTNVIAVEVHQSGTLMAPSVDRYFDLSIQGVTGACAVALDRPPYLQVGTPTSVIVRWKTDVLTNSKVKYGTSPGSLTNEVVINTNDSIHVVPLTGLSPNTKYYYSVGYTCGIVDNVLASGTEYYYYSLPNNTTDPLRYWILGDVCSGEDRQYNVRTAYMNYLGANRLHGIIFGGDNSKFEGFDGKDQALDNNFFPVYPNQLRNTVSWISLGNHDYGARPYNDSTTASYSSFSYPTQGEAGGIASKSKGYYSFDAGDIHFVILNPYHPDFFISRGSAIPGCVPPWDCAAAQGRKNMFMLKFDDPSTQTTDFNNFQQVKWLKLDLANTTKKWKIVLFHTPPYTKGSHDSDPGISDWSKADGELKVVRELLVPILEQYKVDLIVTSHTHSYARSFLMQGVTGTPTKTQFRTNPNQLLQSWTGKYTPVPSSKPYIKNAPYNGAVQVVTGNAGRGGSGPNGAPENPNSGVTHPVMYYGDSTATLNATGGSVELLITKNRLDVKYIKLDSDFGTTSYIKDEFTIMKDVNKKTTYTNPTLPLTLTASWEGTYSWKIIGGGSLPNTTQAIAVSPSANTTYIVNDGYNGGNGFLADTFIVNVCAPTLTLNSTISTSTVYQAEQWIQGTNTNIISPSATVEYRAGYVLLAPLGNGTAFQASPENGFYFLALPIGCNTGGGGGGAPAPTSKKNTKEGVLPTNNPAIKGTKKGK